MQLRTKAQVTAFIGVMLSLAMVLGYVESLLPVLPGIPGVKLGLPNLIVLLLLYKKESRAFWPFLENFLRIVLSAVLFGSIFSFTYALCAGMISALVMFLLSKVKAFSVKGVSIAGGVIHNVIQCIVACILTESTAILYYLPVLLICGALTGLLNGVLAGILLKYLNKGN